MARSTVLRRRGWEDGPPPAFGIALRVLLVIGVFKLIALASGGAFFFVPWLLVPLVFLVVGGALFGGRHYGHGWRHRRDADDLPAAGDPGARPLAGDGPPAESREREYRLEAELATTRRQVRELQEQLAWQGRLLDTPAAPRQSPPGGPEPG
jgi:hypothetical protein